MTSSRITRIVVLTVLALLVSSGGVAAQAEGRTPMELGLTMTGEETTFGNLDDFPPEREAVYVLGSGGAVTTVADCTPPDAACIFSVGWVSEPLFNDTGVPGTIVGLYGVQVSLQANQASQPVAQGTVDFELQYGYFRPGANLHVHGTSSVPVPAGAPAPIPPIDGLPLGALPATLPEPLEMDFNISAMQIPAGGRLALILTVTTEVADFQFTTDGFPTLSYYYGDPDEADSDGDGIPDSLDDDADDDNFDNAEEVLVGSSPTDASSTPSSPSSVCPDYTYQEVYDETGNPNTCPDVGGFPWLMLIVIALLIVLLLGGGFAVLTVAGRKVKVTVSHDGFQAIEQGQTAEYELELVATGKKEEIVPVELSLKGVPEDWSATLEPAHLTLYAGEDPEPQVALLRLTPPADEQYEAEAQVVVTATPTDEEGKTSALNPGSSVKTKTIVNIGITDPEGGKKKKAPKPKKGDEEPDAAEEEPAEAEDEGGKKKRGGFLKRKKKDEEPAEADDATEPESAAPAAAAAAAAPASSKPQIGMGKMSHDPEDFSEGDEVTTTVTVRNKGDAPVEGLRLNLFVNDEKADTQIVELAPGDSAEVAFQWTAQPDENRVRIKGGLKGA